MIKHLESAWNLSHFLVMIIVTNLMSGVAFYFFSYTVCLAYRDADAKKLCMDEGYTSINPILISILLGLRELYADLGFDTRIPFITGNLIVPFRMIPQLYIGLTFFIAFILELQYDFRIIFSLYFTWFYLRFFMKTKLFPQ